jgi:Endonuclease/Exonuclease/phosphatase family
MNEVIRPVRSAASLLWAVATIAALAISLMFASVAFGASEPVTSGSTSLTVKKGFKKKLARNRVKLQKVGSGKVRNRVVQLGATGGEVDPEAGQGSIRHAGGFKLRHRKRSVSVTQVRVDLSGKAVYAKVGKAKMKLGSLAPIAFTREGQSVDARSKKLKLTARAAKRLDKGLGIGRAIKGGDVMSNADSLVGVPGPAVQGPAQGGEPPAEAGPTKVNVMTRNLYLGADLTPAVIAPNLEAFVAANGQILREVTHNDFPTRAMGLAQEILEKKPDLVGLQEAALWRTQPVNFEVLEKGPSATTVRYDYLAELMEDLNAEGTQYEVVVVQNEFDFEAPGDEDENPATGPFGADINGRLTMRDVILKRAGAGVETWNAKGGNFKTLLPLPILGSELPVARGWTRTEASVRGSRPFRFVNTHLESIEPHIRAAQASELIHLPGGPVAGKPTVLVGDLNSDDDTVSGYNRVAYEILQAAGLVERSTAEPLSCCIKVSELGEADGGMESDFDHQVDHVMTNDPADVSLVGSAVTGLAPVNGFWDSDHAGVFSSLAIAP